MFVSGCFLFVRGSLDVPLWFDWFRTRQLGRAAPVCSFCTRQLGLAAPIRLVYVLLISWCKKTRPEKFSTHYDPKSRWIINCSAAICSNQAAQHTHVCVRPCHCSGPQGSRFSETLKPLGGSFCNRSVSRSSGIASCTRLGRLSKTLPPPVSPLSLLRPVPFGPQGSQGYIARTRFCQ